MTIEYLDSKRISGLSTDVAQTLTTIDLSSSSGWTFTGSTMSVDTTNEYLQGSSSVNDDRGTKALGITLSDTAFIVRQKMELVTVTSGGNGQLYFGYTDKDNSTTVLGNRDGIGIIIRTSPDMKQSYANAQAWQEFNLTTTPTATTYYVEIKRTSATSITLTLYSDSDYTTVIETNTSTISSGIVGLNHITIGGWDNGASGIITGRFSDIKIYNGVSSLTSKPTNVQGNSILVEKDTGMRYWFDAEISNLALTDPTPASSDYTNSGSSFTFASNKIHVDAVGYGSTLTMCTRPLTTTFIPTTNGCMIDFKFDWTTAGGSGNDTGVAVGLFDVRDQSDNTNNGIWIEFVTSPSYARNVQFKCEGVFDNSSVQGYPVPDEYYCRIIVQKDGSATGKGYTSEADRTADTNAVFSRSTAAQTGFSEKTLFGVINTRPTGGGNVVGDLDSIDVYSGITATTPATWTNDFVLLAGTGIFCGGTGGSGQTNIMDYITIATTGNAIDYGDLTVTNQSGAGVSSETRGVIAIGDSGGSVNTIDYITLASLGNSTDFGDTTQARNSMGGVSNLTRGVFAGGHGGSKQNTIDYITIATIGNATDFGDLTASRYELAGVASSTRGVFSSGNGDTRTIDYITIATAGNASDFGDNLGYRFGQVGVSNLTRGCFGGGYVGGNTAQIEYITIASTGNSTNFGNLTTARRHSGGVQNSTRGVMGGSTPTANTIDYITIATAGNAVDFGDLTVARYTPAGVWS